MVIKLYAHLAGLDYNHYHLDFLRQGARLTAYRELGAD